MGFVKFTFIVTLLVGITAVLVQHYSPETVDKVLSDPTVQELTLKANKLIKEASVKINETGYPLYVIAVEKLKPVVDYANDIMKPVIDYAKDKINEHLSGEQEQTPSEVKSKKSGGRSDSKKAKKERIFTVSELKKYDGLPGSKGLYLALMGQVFNVKKGKKHYGPDGGYKFFAGRDASQAFVSGNFDEAGLTDDIRGMTPQDYIGLKEWKDFYHKDYTYVGKLAGRYYTADGAETEYKLQADRWLEEARQGKDKQASEEKVFPQCNSEWNPDGGSRVWCTKKSGGVERAWVGVPRLLFTTGRPKPRCACVKDFGVPIAGDTSKQGKRGDLDHPRLKEYQGCPAKAPSCSIPKEK